MNKLIFDSSSIISLSEKCFSRVFEEYSKRIELVIPESVEAETVTRPLGIERFELNAVRIQMAVRKNWLRVMPLDPIHEGIARKIMSSANSLLWIGNRPLVLLQEAETHAIALAMQLGSNAVAVDERNTRLVIEDTERLGEFLEKRFGKHVEIDREKQDALKGILGGVKVVRSVELFALAFKQGMLSGELEETKQALEAGLLSLKFSGCAVSRGEIARYLSGEA